MGDARVGGRSHGAICLWMGRRGRSGMPPPDGHQMVVRQDGAGSISKLCYNKQRSLGLEW